MRIIPILLALSLAFSCQSTEDSNKNIESVVPIDLSEWAGEVIQFPPSFAPTMPAGREHLLFAPGWRTPGTDNSWAYVLLMEIEEPNLNAARIAEILDLYYDGLMGAVAQGKAFTVPQNPATVAIQSDGTDSFQATVTTYDSFNSGEPLTLHMLIERQTPSASSTILRIQASPTKPGQNPIWPAMQQAIDSLTFDD
ncbi:MAG: hypothetical protein JKY61_09950 [Planctomycetes bacterium]|nr:hypothetical protein [Planctomycetota bacterium]